MNVLCITGGIGSGKSLVCRIFSVLGIPVFEADAEAKRLYREDASLAKKLRARFPATLFTRQGLPDTARFSAYFFEHPGELAELNRIVHPSVAAVFQQWTRKQRGVPYVIKEAAILFESGSDSGCTHILGVTAPASVRLERVMQRDGRSSEAIRKIMERQLPPQELEARCDSVLVNDGERMVIPQVLEVHRAMMKSAGGAS
jgi:dephospho-CoA kinase